MIEDILINEKLPLTQAEQLRKNNFLWAKIENCQRIERELLHKLGQTETLSEYNSLNAQRVQAIRNTEDAYFNFTRNRTFIRS